MTRELRTKGQIGLRFRIKTVRLVECERNRLIVGIDYQITATRLVVRIDEPLFDVVK